MRFDLQWLFRLTTVVAFALALWRHGVESYERGCTATFDKFISTGVVKRPSYGAIVPLENHINLHVITKWKPKPGKAIVEVWECDTAGHPELLRSYDVDVTPSIEEGGVKR